MTHWYNSEPLGSPFHNTTSKSLIRNFIWKPWVACAWGQKVSTCIFFLAMQWKKFSIHLETDGSFRLPVSKLNNRFFLQKNALVQETFFSTYLKKSILSKHIFILVKTTGHCLSKYKLQTIEVKCLNRFPSSQWLENSQWALMNKRGGWKPSFTLLAIIAHATSPLFITKH